MYENIVCNEAPLPVVNASCCSDPNVMCYECREEALEVAERIANLDVRYTGKAGPAISEEDVTTNTRGDEMFVINPRCPTPFVDNQRYEDEDLDMVAPAFPTEAENKQQARNARNAAMPDYEIVSNLSDDDVMSPFGLPIVREGETIPCSDCNGRGAIEDNTVKDNTGLPIRMMQCPVCEGSGTNKIGGSSFCL